MPDCLPTPPLLPPISAEPPQPPERLPSVSGEESADAAPWWRLGGREVSSCAISCSFHALLLFALGLMVHAALPEPPDEGLIASIDRLQRFDPTVDAVVLENPDSFRPLEVASLTDLPSFVPRVALPFDEATGAGDTSKLGGSPTESESANVQQANHAMAGGGLEGRNPKARAHLAARDGATRQSEEAVERGLRWLVAHQREDGSWNFDHRDTPCYGKCANPGTVTSTTGATAIALAPFLGAGYTHFEGEHRQTVKRGLYYLMTRATSTAHGVDLQEGTMYAQGLSSIVLSEAYAMTGDLELKALAQQTVKFIEYAQDTKGGGWRYTPGEPGDTTVTGWQLMALKSAQLAHLHVRSPTVLLVNEFLDSVQLEDGARYGYMTPEAGQTTTAIGLLCRMVTGWPRSQPALARGVGYLDQWGPSEDDIYFNYYATQVMRHWEGPEWTKWNEKMREFLIASQADAGHESGSWHFTGGQGESGGRLYSTAMAVMTLEVYYRYMPLYRPEAFEE